jgi:hypothetical protein
MGILALIFSGFGFAASASTVLSSLYPAQSGQRIHNLPRPLRHFVFAQRALVRLKLHA